ncbi:MAG: heme o synthase [Pseudobdellovibrionaceae bacterium]
MAKTLSSHETQDTTFEDYFSLLKPGVMSLVVFTGLAGWWVAPGREEMHPFLSFVAILALALGSGAAGAFNMWYERHIDALMKRTKGRALPQGKIEPDNALGFAIFATLAAVMLMGLTTNWAAAFLLLFASFFYVVIYTVWLKPRTPQNIVIGGAAGAFPPMIGWAAVTGHISLFPVLLFAIIFMWTPPHFWALSLFANSDYKAANIPMMSVVKGERSTKIQMLVYTFLLAIVAMLPWALGFTGAVYGISSLVLNLLFIASALHTLKSTDLKAAKTMFGYSVFYLFALYLALMIDHI